MSIVVKQEFTDSDVVQPDFRRFQDESKGLVVMNFNGATDTGGNVLSKLPDGSASSKWMKPEPLDVTFPADIVEPLLLDSAVSRIPTMGSSALLTDAVPLSCVSVKKPTPCRQFWKAGDYEGDTAVQSGSSLGGINHARIHPKFLHSNATSHKWALGAFAELLDNALDEACNGATYVKVDMLINKKDGSKMLLVEDNGGGMSPDKMRQCMSLGYSAKSKLANTIGQYGNGFKTSTMRLGADVIVFSSYPGKDGKSPTRSIGLLSYTFLRSTGKEDIVVPVVDYEKVCQGWKKMACSSQSDWTKNLEAIVQWSPYSSESDLLEEISSLEGKGTRIIIYNLWEDDHGELELDFDTDSYDIQLRGVNRDEKKIDMSQKFPNSRHFLTYRHSLRSYASIIYLRLPEGFRMILRGKDVEHHNIVNDMMLTQEITYRPLAGGDRIRKYASMVAVVTIGFVKDAKDHVDVQGFNVYHKNRLIKPFWRVWNAAGSDGRGVIGVLEANFVEPAHDKQDFERTTILSRLETRLVQIQKNYWSSNCHRIGYAPRNRRKSIEPSSPECLTAERFSTTHRRKAFQSTIISSSTGQDELTETGRNCSGQNIRQVCGRDLLPLTSSKHVKNEENTGNVESRRPHLTTAFSEVFSESSLQSLDSKGHKRQPFEESERSICLHKRVHKDQPHTPPANCHINCEAEAEKPYFVAGLLKDNAGNGSKYSFIHKTSESALTSSNLLVLKHLEDENHMLRKSLKAFEEKSLQDCQEYKFKARIMSLEAQVQEYVQKLQEANREQEYIISIFSEEKQRHCKEVEALKKKLMDSYATIRDLQQKLVVKREK